MDWMKIVAALALLMFIIYIFPRAREAVKNSPKGSSADWMSFLVPIAIIAAFIFLLVKMV